MDGQLRLEYACTPAETSEAQELSIAPQFAHKSKWLTKLFLFIVLVGLMLGAYFQALQIAPNHPVYCGLSLIIVFVIVHFLRSRKQSPTSNIVIITPAELKFNTPTGQVCFDWTAFDKQWESETLFVLRHRSQALIYVFPKRIFPDETALDWFRTVSSAGISTGHVDSEQISSIEKPVARFSPSENGITIQFKLGYRDYLDRALGSWVTRGIMLLLAAVMLIGFVSASLEPSPGAVYTTAEVWCFFCLPFLIVFESVIFFVVATQMWLLHRSALTTQTVTITEKGIMDESANGKSVLSWEQPTCYKETRKSFIVWWPGTQGWSLLPKRAFPSEVAINDCRKIMTEHSKRSTWFL